MPTTPPADGRTAGYAAALAAQLAADVADRRDLTPDRKVQLAQAHALLAVVDELALLRDVVTDIADQLTRARLTHYTVP